MRAWLVVCLGIFLALPAAAVVLRSGDNLVIPAGETIDDDLVISGGNVRVLGTVNGDLVAAGGNVFVEGRVRNNLIVAGGTVDITGPVGGSVYAGAGTLNSSSTVGRNFVAGAGTFNARGGSRVGRDLAVGAGTANVAGTIARDVQAGAGTLNIEDGARIGGDLIASTNDPRIAPGAVIVGERTIRAQPADGKDRRGAALLAAFFWRLFTTLGLLLIGLLTIALFPRATAETTSLLRARPWASMLAGLILLIVVPIAAVIIMVTIIGIPLGVILLMLYFIAVFVAPLFAAIVLGYLIWRKPGGSLYLALLIGVGVYFVLRLIPFLGGLVGLVALLAGLGALVLALQARRGHPLVGPAPAAA